MNAFDEVPHADDFFITTEKRLLDHRWLVANLLGQSWAECWTHERLTDAIQNSTCFGLYQNAVIEKGEVPKPPKMIGFARVISDGTTYSLLVDVIIDPNFRKRGLAKFLIATICRHPSVRGTVSLLRTGNAEKLYEPFGYKTVSAMRRIPTPS